ncbi:uncharacterized protein LOC130012235 [Patella vulgata]|uniref:uncharacterized protein LOC130012235 n=1 Tax=Patella vulgata TaxID=6465 RepID=UPI0024A87543|nr:uncharacterized protein LOC130012235 [Patella vulgata]
MLSLDSNINECELRQKLETAVSAGCIGEKEVSPVGFSFERIDEAQQNMETNQLQKTVPSLLQSSGLKAEHKPTQNSGSKAELEQEQGVKVEHFETGEMNESLRTFFEPRHEKLKDDHKQLKERLKRIIKLEKEQEDYNVTEGGEANYTKTDKDVDEECKIIQTIPLIKQEGKMVYDDYSKIRNNMAFLMHELDPDDLITVLFSKCVLTKDDVYELEKIAESNKRRCVSLMLMKLWRRGTDAYKKFLKCLELRGYWLAIKRLEPDSVRYKSHIKYPGEKYLEVIDSSNPHRKECINEVEDNIEGLYPESTEFIL